MNHPLKVNPVVPAHERFYDEYVHNLGLQNIIIACQKIGLKIIASNHPAFLAPQVHKTASQEVEIPWLKLKVFPMGKMQFVLKVF